MSKKEYRFEVNGAEHASEDAQLTGREVLSRSGHDPAADHRLIELLDRRTSSIGLDDPVVLKRGVRRAFRADAGDRDFALTVDDRGWAWGSGTISEADIRRIGRIPDDRDLVVEIDDQPDKHVPRGGTVDLTGGTVERIYSRPAKNPALLKIFFLVNGESYEAEVAPTAKLIDELAIALEKTENTGQPIEAWQVTDAPGHPLDTASTFAELGVRSGDTLVVSLRTGAAG